ncbi:MAG TPA: thiol:disulfide interchange protein DsbA/DsbL [Burkholderiaceae bacterium]|nr:thiol:disulfide interchange protein DsbA/DsbL [Burkholderiaceae bacterium]
MNRREFSTRLIGAGAGTLALTLAAPAWSQGAPAEGAQFTKIDPPVPTQAQGKIEVLEFFSYACPHCNAFEPSLDAWAKKLPADVAFRRVPVPFLMNAELFQRTYFALESLGMVDAMQRKVFAAIHVDRARLDSANDVAALVAKNGGDSAKFLDAMKSFGVANGVTRAKKMTVDYKIESVPSIAVQGRFVTSPAQAGSPERALQVADFLIQRSRKG